MSDETGRATLTPVRHELLAEVVTLYYNEGLDQRAIAERLELSRSTISRMISEARELGIVEIRINRLLPLNETLRRRTIDRFAIRDAVILSADNVYGDLTERIGTIAAQYVGRILPIDGTLAISWGTSLAALVDALPDDHSKNARIVQMIGAAGSRHPEIDGAELARRLGTKLGGSYVTLNVPLIVDDPDVAAALLRQQSVSTVLERAANAQVAIIGLGSMTPDSSSLVRSGFASIDDIESAVEAGVVGDAGGHMLSADGDVLDTELSRRMLRLDLPRLRAIPRVIAIAFGEAKVEIILAALKSGIVDVIVSDAATMDAVLESAGAPD
jgi:deoxyribonucleoside regulator